MELNNVNNKARYNLASSYIRLLSKFLDLIVIVGIIVGLIFALFYDNNIYSWKVLVLSLFTFLLFFIWFIIVPFLTNGYTLFSSLFKIKIYSISLKNVYLNKWYKNINFKFLLELIKREIFLWFLPAMFFVLFGFVTLAYPEDTENIIKNIINRTNANSVQNVIMSIFISLISLSLLCPLILIFNILLSNKKRSWNDYFSNTIVIKMVDTNSSDIDKNKNFKEKKNIKIKYSLPGEIDPETITE